MIILLIGSNGQLGKEFKKYFEKEDINYFGYDRNELDITDLDNIFSKIDEIKPDIIINCSAYNLVDKAEEDNFDCYNVNYLGVYNLAYTCMKKNIFLIHYSSDYVFDGYKNDLYVEEDITKPLNQYGMSKLMGERIIKEVLDKYLIFRLSWVYGDGEQNFIYKLQKWSENKTELDIVDDEISVPTSTKTIVNITMRSIEKNLTGLYHLVNSGYCSRNEWAKEVFKILNKNVVVNSGKLDDFNLPAKRPKFSAMSNSKLSKELDIEIIHWRKALKDFIDK